MIPITYPYAMAVFSTANIESQLLSTSVFRVSPSAYFDIENPRTKPIRFMLQVFLGDPYLSKKKCKNIPNSKFLWTPKFLAIQRKMS